VSQAHAPHARQTNRARRRLAGFSRALHVGQTMMSVTPALYTIA
jgi:hypothetical protein